MAEKQETADDIIAEMRKPHDEICAKCHDEPNESCPYCGDPNGCNSPEYGQWPGVMTQLADDLDAAHKRERGDCAKLREALKQVNELNDLWFDTFTLPDGATSIHDEIENIISAALAAPPRNCDVYTADELKVIFNSELVLELPIANEHEKNLVTITAMGVIDTLFATTQEGDAK